MVGGRENRQRFVVVWEIRGRKASPEEGFQERGKGGGKRLGGFFHKKGWEKGGWRKSCGKWGRRDRLQALRGGKRREKGK
ncbi:hypothetical protein, partial [Enterococcus faecium]